jgi:putative transposase
LQRKRHGQAGASWYVDETDRHAFKENGAISLEPLIMMGTWLIRDPREKRERDAAKQFFEQAVAVVGHAPESVTTDGHRSSPRARRETIGNEVIHRTNVYLNNRIEQDHRGIEQR